MQIAVQVVAAGMRGQDRAEALARADKVLLVVADGAGGTTGGTAAAQTVVERARSFSADSAVECVRFLLDLDRRLATTGQTTAVLVAIAGGQVWGASVGDSRAWLLPRDGEPVDLTENQKRKPLLGSGDAHPIGFGPIPRSGRLVIGTDGLFNYLARANIVQLASTAAPSDATAALVAAARLRSGTLRDDIAVIVVE